jgi:Arf-GAP domain and FG repeat-containing protein 1
VGSFVCTSCSGLLIGINPPHRVKSISMANFTTEEVGFLKNHGNDLCNKVWLHAFDNNAMLDIREEAIFRDFLAHKYERRRWYLPASDDMHNQARR